MSSAAAAGQQRMGRIEVDISVSVDGFVTGPGADLQPGLGVGGEALHHWVWRHPEGRALLDELLFQRSGAVVTSRRVYEDTGGWGEDGFYGMPVFVVTHRPHEVVRRGDTTFTFVTGGITAALDAAQAAAGARNVHVMGGASVARQVLASGRADLLRLHVAPVLLGGGTPLFDGLQPVRLEHLSTVDTPEATHLTYRVVN
ncbi:dihydrofolate reductase family protein [Dactylosporangium sp. AC04546]|uniref:dihydrofolate reductase family protein n=1 Tax=Dactylosporangium sp. AC04546 TaxID=2862460 RepID=UPI001EDFF011|nr:dihydrofolate reductase family protein [Dactylosporangium sp. AC04546]WVK78328.1 dihydrofolate reductase family protein [Dactylosporangium sp. AC04546]